MLVRWVIGPLITFFRWTCAIVADVTSVRGVSITLDQKKGQNRYHYCYNGTHDVRSMFDDSYK
jgi:hypothetical protein